MEIHARAREYPESTLRGPMADEAELTAGVRVEPGKTYGFFTDTSLCIGCKSCEVACKTWNGLRADDMSMSGYSYDNSRRLSATTWRHVAFVEKLAGNRAGVTTMPPFQSHWLMMSDVCKHCERAGCLEACPTGALFRTEFGSVVVQQDICNGCGYCAPSCPFGVVDLDLADGKAHKCTLCYDRLKGGLEPACSKACPTDSIQFGEVSDLYARAERRVLELHRQGVLNAYLYGPPRTPGATGGIEGLHAFFLLLDRPEVYNLPVAPTLPARHVGRGLMQGILTMAGFGVAAALVFMRSGGKDLRGFRNPESLMRGNQGDER